MSPQTDPHTSINLAVLLFVALALVLLMALIAVVLVALGRHQRRARGRSRSRAEPRSLDPWTEAGKRIKPYEGEQERE